MTDPQKSGSWWQTLPGILTGLAAFITAISGLIALLYQNGLLGNKAEQIPSQVTATATTSNATEQATPANISPPSRKPWSEVEAVVLSQDGTETRVRADSFSNCISVNHELTLEAGQSIPFNRMSSFEVLHADDHTSTNAKAKIKIELLNGSAVSGTVEANCDLFGNNDVGRFTTYYDQIRSVHFEY
ncbi:MAG TPA: hypothetical protein VK974_00320 [Methylophilaceae bacterium]|nr:hypothetical protein [Methylophilaceae bacterium]